MLVSDLINKALQLIGVIAAGETPASEESDDALAILNNIVASWNAQQIPLFAIAKQTVTLTGAASYTLATRILRVKAAQVVATAGVSQPVTPIDSIGWNGIADKTRTGVFAEALFCDYAYPTANVYLTPKPSSGTLELWAYTPLAQFTGLSQVIDLPAGFERALRYALAIDLAPEYGRQVTPEIAGIAQESKGALTALNAAALGDALPTPVAAVAAR